MHSAATVAKVGPLATVSSLPLHGQLSCSFTVWLAVHLVAGLFGIAFPLPPLPSYILLVRGCYSLACVLSCLLILIANCLFFFSSFISMVFIFLIIIIVIIIILL